VSEQIFADGLGAIVVVGGTVRLDLVTLVPGEGDEASRPRPAVNHRLIMPVESFAAMAAKLKEVADAISSLPAGKPQAAAPQPAAEPKSKPPFP
jgi:hypothetical protein